MELKITSQLIFPICLRLIGVNVCLSLVAPFLPALSEEKGLTGTEYSMSFGIFSLFRIIFAPLWVFMLNRNKITLRFMFNMGAFFVGVSTIITGYLQHITDYFLVVFFILRILLAINASAFFISLLAILQHEFPTKVGYVLGMLETLASLLVICFLIIAGILHQVSDFQVPFFFYGSLLVVVSLWSSARIPAVPSTKISLFSQRHLLKIPAIWTPLFVIMFSEISFLFIHILIGVSILNLPDGNYVIVALVFAVNKFMYMVSIVMTKILLKKINCLVAAVWISLLLKFFSFLLWTSPGILEGDSNLGHFFGVVILSGMADGVLLYGSLTILTDNAIAYIASERHIFIIISNSYKFMLHSGCFLGAIFTGILRDGWGLSYAPAGMMIMCAILAAISMPFLLDATRNSFHSVKPQNTKDLGNMEHWSLPNAHRIIDPSLTPSLEFISENVNFDGKGSKTSHEERKSGTSNNSRRRNDEISKQLSEPSIVRDQDGVSSRQRNQDGKMNQVNDQ